MNEKFMLGQIIQEAVSQSLLMIIGVRSGGGGGGGGVGGGGGGTGGHTLWPPQIIHPHFHSISI